MWFCFFDWVYFARLIFSGNKKELSQKKKTNYFVCVFYSKKIVPNKNASLLRPRPFALHPYSVGLRSTFVGGVLFYVHCLWVRSNQRPPADIGSLRSGMRIKHKQNADAKGTRYFYFTGVLSFNPNQKPEKIGYPTRNPTWKPHFFFIFILFLLLSTEHASKINFLIENKRFLELISKKFYKNKTFLFEMA